MVEHAGLSDQMDNFLATLVDNNRLGSLPSIAIVFHEEREKAMGIVPAEMITATPLGDDLKERAAAAVERLTGQRVRLTCSVDPDLIGGIHIRAGDMVIDGSVRGQLQQLANGLGI